MLGDGTELGAVYNPAAEIVPTVVLPPTTPLTFQVTAWFEEFCTVALNCRVRRVFTEALEGDTVTVTGASTTAT